ncbi:MAG TPA: hypothetical protein VFK90_12650 [Anaeromyxobacter sp.]|nr:hypothetical protein [Anaeromyxobacter sp.]
MVKGFFLTAALAAASPALGQASQQQQQNPPPQQQPSTQQPAPQQPQSQSTAGSQGQSSSAQPSSPGAASQQVVVNPPPSQQPSVQQPQQAQPNPPPSTTIVNPPAYAPGPTYAQDDVVVRRRVEHNPLMTVATDAAYGGLAGLVIGFGVALVNQWDHWERDLTVGAGAGILAGAAVGAVQAAVEANDDHRSRVAFDGMNRTDKDPVIASPPMARLAFKF